MNERQKVSAKEVGSFSEQAQKDRETLGIIKGKTKEQFKDFSDYHGEGHTELVAGYAKLIALGDDKDVFNAEAAGWTHDWGRAAEEHDPAKRKHAELSGVVSRDFYRKLYEEKRITAIQYGEIQRAVRRHSLNKETPRETLKIVRDADRLSRFGSLGLYHNIRGLVEDWKLPFYVEGQPVIRSDDAPVMEMKEVKCVVDVLNFVFDFRKLLETDAGRRLFKIFEPSYKAFLKLISNHVDIKDPQTWLDFLKRYADAFKNKKEEFEKDFQWTGTKTDFEEWLKFYEQIEDPQMFSEENFQVFLK